MFLNNMTTTSFPCLKTSIQLILDISGEATTLQKSIRSTLPFICRSTGLDASEISEAIFNGLSFKSSEWSVLLGHDENQIIDSGESEENGEEEKEDEKCVQEKIGTPQKKLEIEERFKIKIEVEEKVEKEEIENQEDKEIQIEIKEEHQESTEKTDKIQITNLLETFEQLSASAARTLGKTLPRNEIFSPLPTEFMSRTPREALMNRLWKRLAGRKWPDEFLQQASVRLQHLQLLTLPFYRRSVGNVRLSIAGETKPHPAKDTGEDAFFICPEENVLGVADGVSEWKCYGIDPRLFAEQLMQGCLAASKSNRYPNGTPMNRSLAILKEGYSQVRAYGGSTALVAALNDAGSTLDVANIGDSTLIVLRRDAFTGLMEIFIRTVEMQHSFNTPFQIMKLPELSEVAEFKETGYYDIAKVTMKIRLGGISSIGTTDDVTTYKIPIREGDLLIMGTDGLFDNLYDEEIVELSSLAISPVEAEAMGGPSLATSPQALCSLLVDLSTFRSNDQNAEIPFFDNAKKAGVLERKPGGKLDDVAVVAAWVVAGEQGSTDVFN